MTLADGSAAIRLAATSGRVRKRRRTEGPSLTPRAPMPPTLRNSDLQSNAARTVVRVVCADRRFVQRFNKERLSMIIIRNVFQLKFGKAREAVALMKEGLAIQQRVVTG